MYVCMSVREKLKSKSRVYVSRVHESVRVRESKRE